MQYLKIAVAQVSKTTEGLPTTRVPELCSIRNIVYGEASIIIRKAVSFSLLFTRVDTCNDGAKEQRDHCCEGYLIMVIVRCSA